MIGRRAQYNAQLDQLRRLAIRDATELRLQMRALEIAHASDSIQVARIMRRMQQREKKAELLRRGKPVKVAYMRSGTDG